MNTLERKMTDILLDLKENHYAECVKAEFETEGTTFDEAVRLKDISNKVGLGLAIKIGGCEAIRDLYDVKNLCVNEIVAPMIETPYALKKFNNAVKNLFTDEEQKDMRFYINIETITGYNNLQDIILSDDFANICGIVLGRNDMIASMNMLKKHTDSDLMLNMAQKMSEKVHSINKNFTVGGNISPLSCSFLSKIHYLSRYETRKVIFSAKNLINSEQSILKALEFEMLWIKNNRDNYGIKLKEEELRLSLLESRCNCISSGV